MSAPRHYEWEDYLNPDSQVLRNRFDTDHPLQLYFLERDATAARQAEIEAHPDLIERTFTSEHLQALHTHLFGDVYEWAGQYRTVNMGTRRGGGPMIPFGTAADLRANTESLFRWLREQDIFQGAPVSDVVAGVATFAAQLNSLHPFREGNGRTMRLMLDQAAEHSGHRIDWSRIDPAEQNEAFAEAHATVDARPVAAVLMRAIEVLPEPTRECLHETAAEVAPATAAAVPDVEAGLVNEVDHTQPLYDPDPYPVASEERTTGEPQPTMTPNIDR